MFVPFEKLPETARIWIYQADRRLSSTEIDTISAKLKTFTIQWTAHNQTLGASFAILYNQFVVLAVDEDVNQASGCSIDASVRAVKTIGESLGLDFFKRTNVAFLKDGEVRTVPSLNLLKTLVEKEWNGDTLIFNNAILSKGELDTSWKVPAANSWLKRYLEKAPL